MKKRTLLTILLVLLLVLMALLFYFLRDDTINDEPENTVFESNHGIVFNQGESVLKYKNKIFFVDNLSSSLIGYDTQNGKATVIAKAKNNSFNDNLYIVNNNLLYSINNTTYYMRLDTWENQKFSDGRVLYIDDEIYIFLLEEDSMQYLYITSYDGTNFRRTNTLFYNLAKGYKINYLKESNGLLLFSSVNSDNSTSLFSVDLEKYKVNLIIKEETYNSETSRGEIIDAVKCGDEIYYTVAKIFKTTETEVVSTHDLYVKPINAAFNELIKREVEPFLIASNDKVVYGILNPDSSQYEWNTLFSEEKAYESWIENIDGDVSRYFSFENLKLYFNKKELKELENGYSDYNISYAANCDGYIYILLENGSSHVWISCKLDGSEFYKIYEVK